MILKSLCIVPCSLLMGTQNEGNVCWSRRGEGGEERRIPRDTRVSSRAESRPLRASSFFHSFSRLSGCSFFLHRERVRGEIVSKKVGCILALSPLRLRCGMYTTQCIQQSLKKCYPFHGSFYQLRESNLVQYPLLGD